MKKEHKEDRAELLAKTKLRRGLHNEFWEIYKQLSDAGKHQFHHLEWLHDNDYPAWREAFTELTMPGLGRKDYPWI